MSPRFSALHGQMRRRFLEGNGYDTILTDREMDEAQPRLSTQDQWEEAIMVADQVKRALVRIGAKTKR